MANNCLKFKGLLSSIILFLVASIYLNGEIKGKKVDSPDGYWNFNTVGDNRK